MVVEIDKPYVKRGSKLETTSTMKLKIVQAGDPVLREVSRPLAPDEIKSASFQQLIELMRETMRDAPGVGLAAPQVGLPLQLAVIEDRAEYTKDVSPEQLAELRRAPVGFHVIINPRMSLIEGSSAVFFEGCLSVAGFVSLVRRAIEVRVECLNDQGEAVTIEAQGWYARILQHEIDHLNGILYIDRMEPRSFMTADSFSRYRKNQTIARVRTELGLSAGE